jgi:hypothetical protein
MSGALSGCSLSDETPTLEDQDLVESSEFQGVWRQEGYARLLSVEDDQVRIYDLTASSCVHSDGLALSDLLDEYDRLSGNEEHFSWYERGAFTRYSFNKEAKLPSACTKQSTDPVATFDALYQLFDENYGFFKERGIDWQAAAALGDELSSKSSDEQLMGVFQEMLTPFGDGHVYIFDLENGSGFLGGSLGELWDIWAAEYEGNPASENPIDPRGTFTLEMQNYVLETVLKGEGKSGSYDMLHWGWLNDEVGYLDVHAMGTFEAEIGIEEADIIINDSMLEIMSELRDAEAIVVDARFNQGGYDTIGYAIASWFNNKTSVLSQKKAVFDDGWTELQDITIQGRKDAYQGPVYLLTSANTISAAETFSLAMRELSHVTLVGTRTYGSLSDAMGRLLPNGWLVSLSKRNLPIACRRSVRGRGRSPRCRDKIQRGTERSGEPRPHDGAYARIDKRVRRQA